MLSVLSADEMPALKCPEDQVLKLSRPKADRQETDGRVSVTRTPGPGVSLAGFGWPLVNFPDVARRQERTSDHRRERPPPRSRYRARRRAPVGPASDGPPAAGTGGNASRHGRRPGHTRLRPRPCMTVRSLPQSLGLSQRLPRRPPRRVPRRSLPSSPGRARGRVLHPRCVERRPPAALVVPGELEVEALMRHADRDPPNTRPGVEPGS